MPAIKEGFAEESNQEWPKVTVQSLERSLLSKLPFVLLKAHNRDGTNKMGGGTITVYKKGPITPIASASVARDKLSLARKTVIAAPSSSVKTPKLPKVVARKHHYQQQHDFKADLIEIVDDLGRPREIGPRPAEITSPYHITIPIKQGLADDRSKFRTTSNILQDEEATRSARFDTTTSYYQYPTATNPFCIGKSSKSTKAWRESQKQVFLWESTYSASRIHDNFVHDKLEKYLKKSLRDFEKDHPSHPEKNKINKIGALQSPSPKSPVHSIYHYPERFLPFECTVPSTAPVGRDEQHTVLDFLLNVSEMQHVEHETLMRLKTAVTTDQVKKDRYKRKRRVETRDNAASLIRQMYQLAL